MLAAEQKEKYQNKNKRQIKKMTENWNACGGTYSAHAREPFTQFVSRTSPQSNCLLVSPSQVAILSGHALYIFSTTKIRKYGKKRTFIIRLLENFQYMLDTIDKAILNALRWDAKAPLQMIAKKIQVPLSTVHHRVKRFEKLKIITRYETKLDFIQLERPIQAFVLIDAMNMLPSGKKVLQQDLMEQLKQIDGVEEAFIITGAADLMVRVRVKDLDEMNELITVKMRKIDGIGSTQSMMIMKESAHKPVI